VSNVTLSIGGRTYRIGCAEGEEGHITRLGETIDRKVSATPGMTGQSEPHMLLYAALLMADELHEAQSGNAAPSPSQAALPDIATPLENLAARLESLAGRLEGTGSTS